MTASLPTGATAPARTLTGAPPRRDARLAAAVRARGPALWVYAQTLAGDRALDALQSAMVAVRADLEADADGSTDDLRAVLALHVRREVARRMPQPEQAGCPAPGLLVRAQVAGELGRADRTRVADHLGRCDRCARVAATVAVAERFLSVRSASLTPAWLYRALMATTQVAAVEPPPPDIRPQAAATQLAPLEPPPALPPPDVRPQAAAPATAPRRPRPARGPSRRRIGRPLIPALAAIAIGFPVAMALLGGGSSERPATASVVTSPTVAAATAAPAASPDPATAEAATQRRAQRALAGARDRHAARVRSARAAQRRRARRAAARRAAAAGRSIAAQPKRTVPVRPAPAVTPRMRYRVQTPRAKPAPAKPVDKPGRRPVAPEEL